MNQADIDLARHRFRKAHDHLKSAQILFDAEMYDDSLSRSYYAMFAAARALLALKQLDSKKHSGVLSLFNPPFVKTGIFARAAGRSISKTRIRRESSDYTDFYLVSREEAETQLEAAENFITTIETAFEKIVACRGKQ